MKECAVISIYECTIFMYEYDISELEFDISF